MLQQLGSSTAGTTGFTTSAASASATTTSSASNESGARKLLLSTVWAAISPSGTQSSQSAQPAQSGGVQALAAALASQLSAGLAAGQDLAPQLTQKIDAALDRVSQQLTAKGIDPAHVQKLIGRFRQELSDALNTAAAQAAAAPGAAAASSAGTPPATGGTSSITNSGSDDASSPSVASVSVAPDSGNTSTSDPTASFSELALRESETLQIQTTDGARVTLRLSAQGAGVAGFQTQTDGSTTSGAAIFSSGRLSVAVSGDLTSADVQAVSNVISQVSALASQFFSGDT